MDARKRVNFHLTAQIIKIEPISVVVILNLYIRVFALFACVPVHLSVLGEQIKVPKYRYTDAPRQVKYHHNRLANRQRNGNRIETNPNIIPASNLIFKDPLQSSYQSAPAPAMR